MMSVSPLLFPYEARTASDCHLHSVTINKLAIATKDRQVPKLLQVSSELVENGQMMSMEPGMVCVEVGRLAGPRRDE